MVDTIPPPWDEFPDQVSIKPRGVHTAKMVRHWKIYIVIVEIFP